MANYYVWDTRRTSDDQIMLPKFASTSEYGVSFVRGRRFHRSIPDLIIDIDGANGSVYTDDLIFSKRRCLVHSERLAGVLKDQGVDNIDYYPCRLRDAMSGREIGSYRDDSGKIQYRYQAANILDTIYCLDRDASLLEIDDEDPNEIWYIHNLRLLEDRLGDVPIFRLGENRTIVIVNEELKEAVEEAGVSGVVFLPADGYRDYPGYAFNNPLNIIGTHDADPFGPACKMPDEEELAETE